MNKNLFSFALLLAVLALAGCLPQETRENFVLTEQVLYISGEKVRLTGRIVAADREIVDHGFYISESEDFTQAITVSLGPREKQLGRFIAEYDGLKIGTQYYYRSYAIIGGGEVLGQVENFTSLQPALKYYFPAGGEPGTKVTIIGNNFSEGTQVFFGKVEAEVQEINNESEIIVKAPPLGDEAHVVLKVVVQDTAMSFPGLYAYPFGVWEKISEFPENIQIYEPMFFKYNNEFVFGLGEEFNGPNNLRIWSYDLNNNSWSELAFPGITGALAPFSVSGYWGSGLVGIAPGSLILSPYFWQYSGNGNFVQKPFLTFRLYRSVAHDNGSAIYVFGGVKSSSGTGGVSEPNYMIYKFDKTSEVWSSIGDLPGVRISNEYPHFIYNDDVYFLLPEDNSLWKYSVSDGSWSFIAEYPEQVKKGGVAMVIGDKVYIGLQKDENILWEYNLTGGDWLRKSSFPGNIRDLTVAYFGNNDKIYFMRSKFKGGRFELDPRMELWAFDPDRLK